MQGLDWILVPDQLVLLLKLRYTPWHWSSKLAVEKNLLSLPTNETKLLSTKCTLRRSVTFFVLSLLLLVLGFWIARAQKCWIIIISLSVVVEITTRRHKYSIHIKLGFFQCNVSREPSPRPWYQSAVAVQQQTGWTFSDQLHRWLYRKQENERWV